MSTLTLTNAFLKLHPCKECNNQVMDRHIVRNHMVYDRCHPLLSWLLVSDFWGYSIRKLTDYIELKPINQLMVSPSPGTPRVSTSQSRSWEALLAQVQVSQRWSGVGMVAGWCWGT